MSTDDQPDGGNEGDLTEDEQDGEDAADQEEGRVRDRIGQEAERARTEFDQRLVDLLSWLLDTETRARIYVYLRQNPGSTSEEIAEGTGLYPSTVREALATLHEEGTVDRRKRQASGAGNNPYEYTAMAPSDLVASTIEDVQDELNTVFNLDRHIGGRSAGSDESDDASPVTITVEEDESDAESRSAAESASEKAPEADAGDDAGEAGEPAPETDAEDEDKSDT